MQQINGIKDFISYRQAIKPIQEKIKQQKSIIKSRFNRQQLFYVAMNLNEIEKEYKFLDKDIEMLRLIEFPEFSDLYLTFDVHMNPVLRIIFKGNNDEEGKNTLLYLKNFKQIAIENSELILTYSNYGIYSCLLTPKLKYLHFESMFQEKDFNLWAFFESAFYDYSNFPVYFAKLIKYLAESFEQDSIVADQLIGLNKRIAENNNLFLFNLSFFMHKGKRVDFDEDCRKYINVVFNPKVNFQILNDGLNEEFIKQICFASFYSCLNSYSWFGLDEIVYSREKKLVANLSSIDIMQNNKLNIILHMSNTLKTFLNLLYVNEKAKEQAREIMYATLMDSYEKAKLITKELDEKENENLTSYYWPEIFYLAVG